MKALNSTIWLKFFLLFWILGPKVSASAQPVFAIYTAETFTIAVVVSCFASLIVGFISGLMFSRRCKMADYSGGFNGAPHLESRRLSRLNETMSGTEPSKMNNFMDNQTVKMANEKNANATSDLKPITQKVKKTYVWGRTVRMRKMEAFEQSNSAFYLERFWTFFRHCTWRNPWSLWT